MLIYLFIPFTQRDAPTALWYVRDRVPSPPWLCIEHTVRSYKILLKISEAPKPSAHHRIEFHRSIDSLAGNISWPRANRSIVLYVDFSPHSLSIKSEWEISIQLSIIKFWSQIVIYFVAICKYGRYNRPYKQRAYVNEQFPTDFEFYILFPWNWCWPVKPTGASTYFYSVARFSVRFFWPICSDVFFHPYWCSDINTLERMNEKKISFSTLLLVESN